MIKLTAIKPQPNKIAFLRYAKAAKLGLEDAAKGALVDFEATTASWDHKVEFAITPHGDGYAVGPVGGATEIYGYVEHGTRAHQIVARRAKRLRFGVGGSPKTRPGFVGSTGGRAGSGAVFRQVVHHPGTKARNFSALIRKKWASRTGVLVQKRIREAS